MSNNKIFLASSIVEFKENRQAVGNFIRKVNNILNKNDIDIINLFICEQASNSIVLGRMQDTYCEELKKSQICILIIGKKLGQYTLEEYEVAKANNIPVWCLFTNKDCDDSVKNFKEKEISYFKSFEIDINNINYYIAQAIRNLIGDNIKVEVLEDGLYINDNRIKY